MISQVIVIVLTVAVTLLVVTAAVCYFLWQQNKQTRARLIVRNRKLEVEKTERQKMEDRLRLGEERYRLLFSNTQDMVFVHGVTSNGMPGPFVEVNDVACEKLELERDKLLSMTALDIEERIAPYTAPGFTREEMALLTDEDILEHERTFATRLLIRQILEKNQIVYERVYITRRGKRIPVVVNAHRFDLMGEPMIMCTARDMTELRAAERDLRESEQRFRSFFAHSPLGVAEYDAERKLVNVNLACLRMFGVPDRLEFGRIDLFGGSLLPKQAQDKLKRGETVRCEASVNFDEVRHLGEFVSSRSGLAHFDVLFENLGLDRDYHEKGYLLQVQDITKRRTAEAALRQSERQLRQAQKMEAIGTLAGGIAHDFNNILTPILGYTELSLMSAGEGERSQEYMREVLKASHRAKELIDQILAFSRQTDKEARPVRVGPIVKEVVKLMRASVAKDIEIKQSIRTDQDVIIGSPGQIHQVLMNLSTNAMHAMQECGGVIEIGVTSVVLGQRSRRSWPHLTPGRYLQLSVTDTGHGMDAETVDRIFEPFFTTKDGSEGTGMGLAVVHGIVTSLNGGISVKSKPGEGTTFNIVFPSIEESALDVRESESHIPLGSERVLFVDDEREITMMVEEMLTSLGYQPQVVTASSEALNLFTRDPSRFDAVITDQVMPGMTGSELAKELFIVRPDLPIILCTGFSENFSREDAEAMGFSGFMMKPIIMRDLADTLRRALDEQHINPAS